MSGRGVVVGPMQTILFGLAAVALAALPTAAQEHPNVAKGFAPDKVFAVGDVDSVNAFNGNLVLSIPIGPRLPLRDGFSYGLTLVYNSNVWDFRDHSFGSGSVTEARISRRSNAGAGWRLSLGQLYSPRDVAWNDTLYWLYVGQDGAEHKFYPRLHDTDPEDPGDVEVKDVQQAVQYTRDGSYLRMKRLPDGKRTIEFPDGTIHTFDTNRRLIEIRDRFEIPATPNPIPANHLRIEYGATTWRLSDSQGRTLTITWSTRMEDGIDGIQRLERIDCPAFDGTAAGWTFQYALASIKRAYPDNDLPTGPGPNNDPATTNDLTVSFLTGITLPDGSSWSMPLSDYVLTNPPGYLDLTGRIKGLRLPTFGKLEWDYGFYIFPSASTERRPWAQSSRGVVARRKKSASGGVEGVWTYTPRLFIEGTGTSSTTQQFLNTITSPLGDKTENYFSVYAFGGTPPGVYPNLLDYGRPFTPKTPDGQGRFLSTRVYDCEPDGTQCRALRSTWVRYEQDAAPPQGLANDESDVGGLLNPRTAQMRTIFEDDCPSGSCFSTDEDFSSFDGLGHYRTRQISGNFPDVTRQTVTTTYNPSRGTYGGPSFSMLPASSPWLLELYTDVTKTNNAGESSTIEHCFDSATGFLQRRRVRKFGRTGDDIVVVQTPSPNGTVGREDWYGGDGAGIPNGELCALAPLGAAGYSLVHDDQFGERAATTYLQGNGARSEWKALDRTIQTSTGLVIAERDVSQIQADYEYDDLGRLTWVKPENGQGAWTEYVYTPATSAAALAKVTIRQRENGGVNGLKTTPILTESTLSFDGLGRLVQEQRKLPGGVLSTRTTSYDAIGNRATVSEWESGVPANRTQYTKYDPFGRPQSIRAADGHEVTIGYTGTRKVSRVADVFGPCGAGGALAECRSETTESYDQLGRLIAINQPVTWPTAQVTDPPPFRTTYGYDIGDRLKLVKQFDDALTVIQQRQFTYDNRGFLTSEKHPEKGANGNGTVTYSGYDARGHARRKQDGPNDLTYEYDRGERLFRVRESNTATATFTACSATEADPAKPKCLKTYTFGTTNQGGDRRLGKVLTATRYNFPVLGTTPHPSLITETYTYAGIGGRVSKRDTALTFDGAPNASFTQGFTWDDLGNPTKLDYPQCTHAACAGTAASPKAVTFSYTEGLLTAVPGYASPITYRSNQTIATIAHVNGVTDTIGADPKAMQRPASFVAKKGATTLWDTGTYSYDGAGNVKTIGGSGYEYDPASRLTRASLWTGVGPTGTPLQTQTYTYDLWGNLQAIGGVSGRNTPTSSATNRLNGPGMVYDAAGNLTANNGAVHEYDKLNQMWHFKNGGEEWLYIYTADDERAWSFKVGGNFSRWTLRDLGNRVLREYGNSAGTWSVVEDYLYRGNQLLAADTSSGVSHFSLDHLGTPRLVTNQVGTKTAYHLYWPYGEELSSPTQDGERMKFTGHERDLGSPAGTGDDLDYMHARFCSPVWGRFLGVDRVPGEPSRPLTWNRYAYALSNPIAFVDPDGNEVVYANDNDRKYYENAAARNYEIRQVLDAFKPGTGRDLTIQRGDPGKLPTDGTALDGKADITYEAHPDTDKMVAAYQAAGGGQAGEDAANAVLDQTYTVKTAVVTLGPDATDTTRRHELGHIDQALRDPNQARKDSSEASTMVQEDYEKSNSERYAKDFAERTQKKKPTAPPPN